ncbi:MAG: TMEM165/GDT1 family protein [Candidatus Thiodiazotropha sp. (ex Lucinoma aequizonata)]|nr:TMEM165/GDT1 family protein [Candidatus Thiodiazotropha sp. (ex Lucinoma aequizonata)]MCU7896273.1 TMEM165/GDT1 family protein [Candidatus Thiodiazotropha sp. (ex Lucinoma aequizonata)]MCU7898713.1 TMEM165/GDT1 family protein [Candidatus Thiodiazotropha sp. (ex Lucinoma aequizonata)]MCU7902339.1 TMEM165/GDT1 family protein [Candidatus Thiodiazotropha sp. (ex Lucinoma aequizonata)]MCU7909269.1 TMEM165/GDT1 family protein [Candidatus Thiodiazotropha sp. (ex Lucinoma aequizonata)]
MNTPDSLTIAFSSFTLITLAEIGDKTEYIVIIQLKNWKKCLTRFFCIFSDFKEDCLPSV